MGDGDSAGLCREGLSPGPGSTVAAVWSRQTALTCSEKLLQHRPLLCLRDRRLGVEFRGGVLDVPRGGDSASPRGSTSQAVWGGVSPTEPTISFKFPEACCEGPQVALVSLRGLDCPWGRHTAASPRSACLSRPWRLCDGSFLCPRLGLSLGYSEKSAELRGGDAPPSGLLRTKGAAECAPRTTL